MSAIPSMYWNSKNDMPWNVFNFHIDVSIDTKLFTSEIYTASAVIAMIWTLFRSVQIIAKVKILAFQVKKLVSVSGSRLGLFLVFLPLHFLGLEDCTLLMSIGIFNSLPSGGRDGYESIITPPFHYIYCSYVEVTFCVCQNLCRLINTEIFINTLLSSFLDR